MNRKLRIAGYIFLGLTLGLGLIVGALFVLTETEYGLERVRRFALGRVANEIEGELRIARIESDGLLGGVLLRDVALDDDRGRPFLRADSARLTYRWRTLLRGRIVFDRLTVYDPEVTVERLPGDTLWNFERIFQDTTPDVDDEDDFILIDRARVSNGLVVVRYPWEPDEPAVEPGDTARLILREVPGGLARELRFEDVDAVLPRVLWESPVEEGKLFRVAELSTLGYIWETPFRLRDLEGVVTIRDSLIAFEVDRFRLPDSRGSGIGRIILDEDNFYDIRIVGDAVAFNDLEWLYPPLPDEGGGELVFRIQSQPEGVLWLAQDAHIRAPGTELRGDFGIVTGDTLYFTQVDLRASPIDLDLIADVLPGDLPIEGLMVGTVVVEGPISSLTTRGDVRLSRAGGGDAARVRWTGTLDLRGPYGAENLDATIDGLDLALLPALRDRFPVDGAFSGRVRATGRLDRSLRFAAELSHRLADRPVAALHGAGTLRYASREASAVEATVEADSVALDALSAAFPALAGLRGRVHGPVTLRGPLSDLAVEAELATAAGRVEVDGRFDLGGAAPRYTAEARVAGFRLDRVVDGLRETALTARVAVEGAGRGLPTTLRVELDSGRVGPVELRGGLARVRLQDGLATVDSLFLDGRAGRIDAAGTFGLDDGRHGTLEITAQIDSLSALRRRLFGNAALALEDTTETRIDGAAYVRATVSGSVADARADGEARLDGVTYRGFDVGRADVRFAALGIGTDSLRVRARADASGSALYSRPLDSAHGSIDYTAGSGRIELEARALEPVIADYRLVSGFRRVARDLELDIRELTARDWLGEWRLAEPARVRLGDAGFTVDDLLLERSDAEGRVHATGRIPWRSDAGPADDRPLDAAFRLEVERLPLAPLRAPDAGPPASAALSGRVVLSGTADAPVVAADLRLADVRYDDLRVDDIGARLDYRDRRLAGRIEARLEDRTILTGHGRVPIDLTLAPVAQRRLDEPLDVRFEADRVPAAFATGWFDGFRDVRGDLTGAITLAGTTRDPSLGGRVALRGGEAVWNVSGVRYRDVQGEVRVLNDQVVDVALSARAGSGTATATGTLTFAPLGDPAFDLLISTEEFQLARRRDVEATGTGEVRLERRYSQPRISGRLRVNEGVLYLDEVLHSYSIVSLDDDLFSVVDTSLVSMGRIRRASTSPFIKNLVVDSFSIDVGRGTRLRGRTLDVEVAGRLDVAFDRRSEDLRLTGTLNAVRGTYELFLTEDLPVRRFAVGEGTVEFDGTPGINPRLDIVGTNRVRTAEGGTLNVQAVVTGTLQNPRVGLRSDAEPPISESDLISLLVFGRPSSELTRLVAVGEENTTNGAGGLQGLLAAPALSVASMGLQSFVSDLGVDLIDHIAITEYEGAANPGDAGNLLMRSQVEVGSYLWQDWYVAASRRLLGASGSTDFDLRLEWRFAPTWTLELFREDRFTRGFSQGVDPSLQNRKALGFFLFREWGF